MPPLCSPTGGSPRGATTAPWRPSTGVCEAVLKGHTVGVLALAVLPDGRLASGSYERNTFDELTC